MKVFAIVAEYNPLHKGHIHQINTVKKMADAVVIILTGHITQRGEFAIFNKWTRAKSALLNGADLVLEMPTIFSCSCAEKFAHAALKIVKELKFITNLSFGSESGNIEEIIKIAKICKNIEKTKEMQYFLKKGFSHPKARELAIKDENQILRKPNNILAVEYVKAAISLNVNVNFHTIKRLGAEHDSKIPNLTASSSYIRKNINNFKKIEKFIPKNCLKLYKNPINPPENIIFNSLRQTTKEELKKLPDTTEGLHNRIYKASKKATSLTEFFKISKTKRYTLTRIKRIAMCSFLKIEKEKSPILPEYCYVLGFNKTGRKLLSSHNNENFLLTTSFKKIYEKFNYSANIDSKATDFVLLFENPPKPCNLNFKIKPIIIN